MKGKTTKRRIQFFVDEERYMEVWSRAESKGLSVDQMARHALFQYLNRYRTDGKKKLRVNDE